MNRKCQTLITKVSNLCKKAWHALGESNPSFQVENHTTIQRYQWGCQFWRSFFTQYKSITYAVSVKPFWPAS